MTATRHTELGLSAPTVEPDDDLVHRLAALAAASQAAPRARRFLRWRVALATAGLVGTGVGGAWAAGSLHVPGLPDRDRPPVVRPSSPAVTPSPAITPTRPTGGTPTATSTSGGSPGIDVPPTPTSRPDTPQSPGPAGGTAPLPEVGTQPGAAGPGSGATPSPPGQGHGPPATPGNGNGNGNGPPASPGPGNGNGPPASPGPGNGNGNGNGNGHGNGNGYGAGGIPDPPGLSDRSPQDGSG